MIKINSEAPLFESKAYHQRKFKDLKLETYKGRWVVLFFYPADFTFICPTELEELADNYEKFREMNVEILSVSSDTHYTHKAWHDHSKAIGKIQFPMVADPSGKIAKDYEVYIEEGEDEGLALRGTFIIDPDGIVKAFEIHNNDIGRSAAELIRKIEAAQFVRDHGGEVCPASWTKGKTTLRPGEDLVGKI